MDAPAGPLRLDASQARAVLLVEALESVDTEGRLLGAPEREQLEREAAEAAGTGSRGTDAGRYLAERTARVLAIVERRDPRLAALRHPPAWQGWMAVGLPLLAMALGAGLDRIGNPQHVNMLSPPLLLFLLWNLAIYALLLLKPLLPAAPAWLTTPLAGLAGGRAARGGLRAAITVQLQARWWRLAGALESWRLQQVLHASAAAWAVGVALSIAVGGLVREYRVGWESTLLDLPQVHAFLRVLFAPVTALLPLDGFTLEDLRRMHFRSGVEVPRAEARHWVALYLALLGLLVVLPRTLLALYAGMRRRQAARGLRLDLGQPYYAALLSRVSPVRLRLGLLAPEPGLRALLLHVLGQAGATVREPVLAPGGEALLLETARGDSLGVALADAAAPAAGTARAGPGGGDPWARLRTWWRSGGDAAAAAPASRFDLVLAALADGGQGAAAAGLLRQAGAAAVVLHPAGTDGAGLLARAGVPGEALPLEEAIACWTLESRLRQAVVRLLPDHRQPGAQRLMQAWRDHQQARWFASMRLLAEPLLLAARDSQEIAGTALSLRGLLSGSERGARQRAQDAATAVLLQRLEAALERSFGQLRSLHGVDALLLGAGLQHPGEGDRFILRGSVDTQQAGLAGAAAGVAAGAVAGAKIDLLSGGLTMGAATALGGLIGGTGALTAAWWKNRAASGGAGSVQLSAEMLQALVELMLLRYLVVIHQGRRPADADPLPARWKSEVIAAVAQEEEAYARLWERARAADGASIGQSEIALALQSTSRRILEALHGPTWDW